MPDLSHINASIQQAIHPPEQQSHALPPHLVQAIMYALQGVDAVNSANNFRAHGMHETNPMMRPFSHGGALTMAAGFGLGDILRHALLRHASPGVRNAADGAQAASNIMGILQTNAAARHDAQNPPQP